ncbi:MAG: OmpH family outer membrane protein [Planctomycetes bacterium]|nr:OmpH family outer membrane protein [Planctomycetota bacterium]
MSRSTFVLTISLAALLLAGALVLDSTRRAAGDEPAGSKIGYVDVTKVFNGYSKVNDRKTALEARYKAEADRLKVEDAAIQEEGKKLELVNPSSQSYIETVRDLQERRYKVGLKLQLTQREFALDVSELTKSTYLEVLREIETFAKRAGYQLVFKIDSEEVLENPDLDPIQYVSNRQILFHAEGRDITAELIQILNRNYIPPAGGSGGEKKDR